MQDIDRQIEKIAISIRTTTWLTPQNLHAERLKFLQNPTYNPHFHYPEFDTKELEKQLHFLENLELENDDTLRSWVRGRRVEELKLQLQLFLTRDTNEYAKYTMKLYGCTFSDEVLNQARKDASSPVPFMRKETRLHTK